MKLDLDPRVEIVLQECPLGTRSNIQDCVTAAQTLQKAINQEQSPGVSILQAVRDQKEYFSRLSSAFGRRLQENLTSQFVHNVRDVQWHDGACCCVYVTSISILCCYSF